ncbi:MAG: efflux transporter outer membrane subunit [Ferrovum sp.]|nr:efflux transporter outer membrane subunit [Ferrovum sp.]
MNRFLLMLGCLVLSSCIQMGPDFVRPKAPEGSHFELNSNNQSIPADWWTLFHCQALNQMVQEGLQNNYSLASMRAALISAKEYANAEQGLLLYPSADATLAQTRQRFSPQAFGFPGQPVIFNLTNINVAVSYNMDLFGANHRQIESLMSQTEVQRYQMVAAQVTLASNIATTAISWSSLQEQVTDQENIVQQEQALLRSVQVRVDAGSQPRSDLAIQSANLAQQQANLAQLKRVKKQMQHQLEIYLGRFPGQKPLQSFSLSDLTIPQDVPISLPSEWVHQRPDILVSESRLHVASANLGYAMANVYPSLSLSAGLGSEALTPGSLFSPVSNVWNIGGGLTQPLFRGGALQAAKRSAEAALDQARQDYLQTVVQAFGNVADVLTALNEDQTALMAQQLASDSAATVLSDTHVRYQAGSVSLPVLLTADEQARKTSLLYAQAKATRLNDVVALYLAMGGGWWNQKSTAQQPKTEK